MSVDMFRHIVALNTYSEPFLALKANDQRTIIEQLLGITLLSEKADALKEQIKNTKDAISQEEFRIKAVTDANKHIQDQIDATKRKQTVWNNKNKEDCDKLQAAYDELSHLDIEEELVAHKLLSEYSAKQKVITDLNKWIKLCEADAKREQKTIDQLKAEITLLENHQCHACGQDFHDDKHQQVLEEKQKALQETKSSLPE